MFQRIFHYDVLSCCNRILENLGQTIFDKFSQNMWKFDHLLETQILVSEPKICFKVIFR